MPPRPARDAALAGVPLAAVVLAVSLLFAVYLGALGVVLPALGRLFGLGTEVQGRLFPANFGGCVSGVLLCGPLSDRWGRKPVLLACLGATSIGLLLFGTAPAFLALMAAAALVGAGSAAAQTVGGALLSDLFPERRAVLLNGTQVAFGVGAIVGPALVGPLVAPGVGERWRILYLAGAGAQTLLFLLLASLPVPRSRQSAPAAGESRGTALLRERPLLLLCLSAALYSGAEVALFSWMPTRLRADIPGSGAAQAAVVSVFWAGMTVGRSATGLLVGRFPLPRLRLLFAAGGAVASALTLLAPNAPLSLAGVLASGLCFSGIFSLLLAEGGDRYPRAAGAALGLIIATSGFGAAVLPWLVGVLSGAGLSWAVALAPVPLAMSAVAALAGSSYNQNGGKRT